MDPAGEPRRRLGSLLLSASRRALLSRRGARRRPRARLPLPGGAARPRRVSARRRRGRPRLRLLSSAPTQHIPMPAAPPPAPPRPRTQVANLKTDFGAKGDGVTDDTAALLAALDAVQKGAVLLPAGARARARTRVTVDRLLARACLQPVLAACPAVAEPGRPRPGAAPSGRARSSCGHMCPRARAAARGPSATGAAPVARAACFDDMHALPPASAPPIAPFQPGSDAMAHIIHYLSIHLSHQAPI